MNYASGAQVHVGDSVRYGPMGGVVYEILEKGNEEAESHGHAEGAVFIRILSDNDLFLLYPPEEEDLILIRRGAVGNKDEGGSGPVL
jgi:hypothetical protein